MSRKVLLVLVSAFAALPCFLSRTALATVYSHKEHKRDLQAGDRSPLKSNGGQAQLAGGCRDDGQASCRGLLRHFSVSGQLNNKMQQLERLKSRNLIISKLDVSDRKVKLVGRVAIVTLPGRD